MEQILWVYWEWVGMETVGISCEEYRGRVQRKVTGIEEQEGACKPSAVETLGNSFSLMMDLINHIMLETGAKLELLFLKT